MTESAAVTDAPSSDPPADDLGGRDVPSDGPAPSDAAEPPPLGDLIARVARAIHHQSRALMAPLGLTPATARALRTLAHPDEPIRMAALAERMHVVPRTVTSLVDTLEEHGLAERRPDPTDRRSTLVGLTDLGRERLRQTLEARRTAAGQLLSALSEEEQLQMRRLLAKLDLEGARRGC